MRKDTIRIFRKKKRRDRVRKALEKFFSDYSKESSIHSLNYIGKTTMHWGGRVFWAAAFVFSLVACVYLASMTFIRWRENPIITTYDQHLSHISEIPFPAITLCFGIPINATTFNETDIYRRIEQNETFSVDEEIYLNIISDLCSVPYPQLKSFRTTKINKTDSQLIDILNDLTREFANDVSFRDYGSEPFHEMFRRTLTDSLGMCHTFNMVEDDKLFTSKVATAFRIHKNFSVNKVFGEVPFHLHSSGYQNGLLMSLSSESNKLCSNYPGFSLHVHSPLDYPNLNKQMISIPPQSFSQISIDPVVTFTPDEMRKYDIRIRQCYFTDEKQLKYFKSYSYANCELECETSFYIEKCGCVKFYVIHENDTRMCQALEETECLNTAFYILQEQVQKCDCLPTCNEIQYKLKFNHIAADNTSVLESGINIFFETDRFVRMKRAEVFGFIEFLSSCGGFLGLLMGGSVLSVVEIIYHVFMKRHFEKEVKIKNNKKLAGYKIYHIG